MFTTTEGKKPDTSTPLLIIPMRRFSPSSFSRELVERRSLSRSRRSSSICFFLVVVEWHGDGGGVVFFQYNMYGIRAEGRNVSWWRSTS